MPVLYGAPLSPYVRKVAVILEEKNIDFEWIPVRPHSEDPVFSSLSPLGKIPAYKDEHIGISDSSVICTYLEKTHPAPPLYPGDAAEFARALWFEEFGDSALIAAMQPVFTQKWLNPQLLGKPTDQALVREAEEVSLPPLLNYLESQLRPDKWIVGEGFSIADVSLATGFVNMHRAGYVINKALYPKLFVYIEKILGRNSFNKCKEFENDFIKRRQDKLRNAVIK